MDELIGAPVELAATDFELAEPVVDGPLPGGGAHLTADRQRAILRIPRVGTFGITEGRHIAFEPEPAVEEGAAAMWLHGTVAALLLAQRGQFALHASVVGIGGLGVAVSGRRGAGKSTTALRLAQLGHTLVTDDVSPLLAGDSVLVQPYTRPVYVFAETAGSLGLDVSEARPVLPQHAKLAMPSSPQAPVALAAIAILEPSDPSRTVETERIRGARAHWLVALNVYRADVLRDLWESELFAWAGALADQLPVYLVTRPVSDWTVDAVARAVEALGESPG